MRVPQSDANFGIGTLAGDDVEIGAAAYDLKGFDPQAAVARAFAGLDVVFVAVPGTHEVRFVGAEVFAEPDLVRPERLLHLVHNHALPPRAALVEAQILIEVDI